MLIFRNMSNYRTEDLERLSQMFKALSNPQRLRIFLKLVTHCCSTTYCETTLEGIRHCVGDLGEDLGLAASTVSHHVKELRQAGLMHLERHGQKIECWIRADALEFLSAFFSTPIAFNGTQEIGEDDGKRKK